MMKCPAFLLLLIICLNTISCQEEGGGDEPTGGHDQPPPDQSNQQNPDTSKGEKGPDGKPAGEQGYTQGFNQGVKPYSYGYNTGIKPYSYNFYQPLGGKPQVVEQGGPDGDKGSPEQKVTSTAGVSAQPSPPPMPAIEFPADFSAFGLSPADLAIPPPPAQAAQPRGRELNTQRRQPAIPVNFPVQPQTRPPAAAAGGQTPPPFNYADYGIPTDIGTATGSAAGSPFGMLDGGMQQQQQQRPPPPRGLDGDDFGIFGNGGNGNANNALSIPVLEDGNNQNNQQQNLAIPLFGGGNPPQNQGNDFNFANNDLSNDFNVAASDFEPFNFQNFVPPEFARSVPLVTGTSTGVSGTGSGTAPKGGTTGTLSKTKSTSNTASNLKRLMPVPQKSVSDSTPRGSQSSALDRKAMYQAAPAVSKKAKRSIDEQPHEKPLKDDPNSAYNILNMDPKYTNPNQGVYSYYPAYRVPS